MSISRISLTLLAACTLLSSEVQAASPTFTITAVGDVMIGSAFPNAQFLPTDDGINSFAAVRPYLRGDVVFGNLEGVLLDSGDSGKCAGAATGRCFAFRMPTRYAQIIKKAGFTALSTANNHSGDFGDTGRWNTERVLNQLNIANAGQKERPCTTFQASGKTIGLCAFSTNRNTININDTAQIQRLIAQTKKMSNIMLVSFHGGAEGANHTHVPHQYELFLGENRGNVEQFAHAAIDAGADVVIGHGPHVTRAVELYKNRFIAYSLGNFNTYGAFNLNGMNGIAPIISIQIQPNGQFVSANVVSTKQTKGYGLSLDKNNTAWQQLQSLTQSDFPYTPLRFVNYQILPK